MCQLLVARRSLNPQQVVFNTKYRLVFSVVQPSNQCSPKLGTIVTPYIICFILITRITFLRFILTYYWDKTNIFKKQSSKFSKIVKQYVFTFKIQQRSKATYKLYCEIHYCRNGLILMLFGIVIYQKSTDC